MTSLLPCLIVVLVLPSLAGAFEPYIRWARSLSGCGTLSDASPRKGNGVVVAQNGKNVWVTDDEGRLHIFDARQGNPPGIIFEPTTIKNKRVESRSSVSLIQNETQVLYAVYSVVDLSNSAPNESSSRVIAVHGDGQDLGTLMWQVIIEGISFDTPQIGNDGRIFITHNTADQGYLSIFDQEGHRIIESSSDNTFGPLSIFTNRYGDDELLWGQSTGRGYSSSGKLQHFIPSTSAIEEGQNIGTSTTVPPIVWTNGKKRRMWLGGISSTIHGWIDGQSFLEEPSWTTQLEVSKRNITFPIVNKIMASNDGLRLFVPSASTSFYCLNARNGNILWKIASCDSIFLTGALLSPDSKSVYIIQHRDGKIEKRSASDGSLLWTFSCMDIPGRHPTCQDSVEADFSLSSNGNELYYTDIWGHLVSLTVDDNNSTGSPTKNPTIAPSIEPSQEPSQFSFSVYPTIRDMIPSSEPSTGTTSQVNTSQNPIGIPSSAPLTDIIKNSRAPPKSSNNTSNNTAPIAGRTQSSSTRPPTDTSASSTSVAIHSTTSVDRLGLCVAIVGLNSCAIFFNAIF